MTKIKGILGSVALVAVVGGLIGYIIWCKYNQRKAKRHFEEGLRAMEAGNHDAAIKSFDETIRLSDTLHTFVATTRVKLAPVYNNRGCAKESKGDLEGAIADHSKAIELDPKHS